METSSGPRAFWDDQRGAALIWLSFSLMAIIGFATLAVDMGYLYVTQTRLQGAADAAALAAVSQLPDETAAEASAIEYATKNMPAAEFGNILVSSDVVPGNWDSTTRVFTAAGTPVNAVQVITRRSQDNGNPAGLFFANILGVASADVTTVAVARIGNGPVCMLALDPTSSDAVTLDSNAEIDLDGCEIHVSSSDSSALSTLSSASVAADRICVAGDYSGGNYAPTPESGCSPIGDPLSGLTEPSASPCNHTNFAKDDYTTPLNAGVYCGGLELNGNTNTTFNPGTYVISGGRFLLDSNTIVQGTGVTFYLTNGALIEFNSNTSIDFTAPTTGTYAGILFFQDPDDGGIHVMDSNVAGALEGVIYLPNGDLHSDSNANLAGNSSCTMLIARRFNFNSNSGIDLAFDASTCSVPLPASLTGGGLKLAS